MLTYKHCCNLLCCVQAVEHLCLGGCVSVTELDQSASTPGADNPADLATVVFSSLFNLRLLSAWRSGFQGGGKGGGMGEGGVGESGWEEEEEVMLYGVQACTLAKETSVSSTVSHFFSFFVFFFLLTVCLKSGGNMGGVSNPELRQLTLF
jgi:hypothetical protein